MRKRVANIDEFLEESISIDDFKQIILKTIFGEHEVEEYKLTDEDWKNIEALSNEKYRTWDGTTVEILSIILNAMKNLKKDLYKSNLMLKKAKLNMLEYSEISLVKVM